MSVQAAFAPSQSFLRLNVIVLLCLYLQGCTTSPPSAPSLGAAHEPALSLAGLNKLGLELYQPAELLPDRSVSVRLRARCPRGFHVIEEPMSLIQGPLNQETFGEGFFSVQCDGRWHSLQVKVFAPEGFSRGRARAGATLTVENAETTEFLQTNDGEVLRIR
jgi:hypothetical protein